MVLMAKKQTQIKTTDLINPHFYKVWHAKCPYILMKGGRGSFKSSVISLKLATEMKKHTQWENESKRLGKIEVRHWRNLVSTLLDQ